MKENIEYQAGAALVDDGICFDVPLWFGLKKKLTIKPLKPGTNVRISMKVTQLENVDLDHQTINEFLDKGKNIKVIAGIIATAIINMELFKLWQYRLIKWLLLYRVEDMRFLFSYWNLVQRQMGADRFFFIMASTPAMNFLKKKMKNPQENIEEEKPSTEPSHSSKKHSN